LSACPDHYASRWKTDFIMWRSAAGNDVISFAATAIGRIGSGYSTKWLPSAGGKNLGSNLVFGFQRLAVTRLAPLGPFPSRRRARFSEPKVSAPQALHGQLYEYVTVWARNDATDRRGQSKQAEAIRNRSHRDLNPHRKRKTRRSSQRNPTSAMGAASFCVGPPGLIDG